MERLDREFLHGTDVLFRELDGEAVLLDLESGKYFGLDAVGTRIWTLLGEHRRMRAVLDVLTHEYDVAPDELRRDLDRFVHELLDAGLLRAVEAGSRPAGRGAS